MKREIPLAITAFTGILMIVIFFVPQWEDWREIFLNWFAIIAGFALVLGAGSLLLVNLNKISRKSPGWGYSVVLIFSLFLMATLGILQGNIKSIMGPPRFGMHDLKEPVEFITAIRGGQDPVSAYIKGRLSAETKSLIDKFDASNKENVPSKELQKLLSADMNSIIFGENIFEKERFKNVKLSDKTWALIEKPDKKQIEISRLNRMLIEEAYPGEIIKARLMTPYDFLFEYVYTPLSATMFSLLAFYIASAAFRAFKAKTLEAGLLLVTAFMVMLGRVPLGEILWDKIPFINAVPISKIIEDWIMGCFNTAGQRAIMLGASIGVISVSMKILLGVERSYLGGGE